MPYKLVAVEPEPENCEWIARHMRDNGIDPDAQWLLPCAISDRNEPVLFPGRVARQRRAELLFHQRARVTRD